MDDAPLGRLRELFKLGVAHDLAPSDFDALALEVVRYQLTENVAYRRFGALRGIEAGSVAHWTDAPPVPTRAFKSVPLIAGGVAGAERVFRTSGTTHGVTGRGEHHVRDLSLYEDSLIPNFRAHLLPDEARLALVALVSDPHLAPDSSLSHMVGVVGRALCKSEEGYFFGPERGLDIEALDTCVDRLSAAGEPVLLVGTAFALVHWTDALAERGKRHRLPPGSRLMETGGFKGRSRTVAREALYEAIELRLGLPGGRVVNEYGMTELLSQFYEPVLAKGSSRGEGDLLSRHLVAPPWVKTSVLDPATLVPVGRGSEGLLHHMDLANVHSVSSVLTEDMGVEVDGGFRVFGRASDREPRGCSLMMEDFLEATGSVQ